MLISSLTITRTRTTWLGYWMLAYYTLLQASVSVLMPFLRVELNLTYSQAGFYMSANAFGMMLSGLIGDRLAARISRRALMWGGALGTGCGLLCLAFGQAAWITMTGVFINGFAGGITQVVIQAILADLHNERRAVALTEANIAAGVGSFIAPLLVGAAVTFGLGWRGSPLMVLAMLAVSSLLFWSAPFPRPSPGSDSSGEPGRLPGRYWLIWLVLFLCVSVEWSVIFWSADFLEKIAGFAKPTAATLMSVYFLAAILGRILTCRLIWKHRPLNLLLVAMGVASAGILLFWLAPIQALRVAGLFIGGLGIGTLYPLGIVEAVGTAPGAVNAASARATLAAGSAIFFAPLLMGWAADQTGIRGAYGLALLLLTAAIGLGMMVKSRK